MLLSGGTGSELRSPALQLEPPYLPQVSTRKGKALLRLPFFSPPPWRLRGPDLTPLPSRPTPSPGSVICQHPTEKTPSNLPLRAGCWSRGATLSLHGHGQRVSPSLSLVCSSIKWRHDTSRDAGKSRWYQHEINTRHASGQRQAQALLINPLILSSSQARRRNYPVCRRGH